jgi:catechol 2,3-dioxygenase-like lactoylglutathione lyase family enzyme
MKIRSLDHAAFPCFDVKATDRFYRDVLGLPLVFAQSGPALVWGAREYLLLAYGLGDGSALDFFTFDGIQRPEPDRLPKDIRHLALSVPTRGDVLLCKEGLEKANVAFWTETHEVDDVHLYTTDPNGVVLEIVAEEDGARVRKRDEAFAQRELKKWMSDPARSP